MSGPRCPVTGIKILDKKQHGFFVAQVDNRNISYAEASGVFDGFARIWTGSHTSFIVNSYNTPRKPDLHSKLEQHYSDLLSQSKECDLVYFKGSNSAQLLQKKVINEENLPISLDTDIVKELLDHKENDNENSYYILEGVASEEDTKNNIIKVLQEELQEDTGIHDILCLFRAESMTKIGDTTFSSMRRVIKTQFKNIYTPIKSRNDLNSFLHKHRKEFLKDLEKFSIEALSSIEISVKFVHERFIRDLFDYTGQITLGLFLEYKFKPEIPQGMLLSARDSYFTMDSLCLEKHCDVSIMPSGNVYTLSVIPYSIQLNEQNDNLVGLSELISYIANKINVDKTSATRIFNIPKNKVDEVIDIFYDVIKNPKNHTTLISKINTVGNTDSDTFSKLPTNESCIKDSCEYEERLVYFKVMRINKTQEVLSEWQASELQRNVSIITNDEKTFRDTKTIRDISFSVNESSHYYSSILKGSEMKKILSSFKSIAKKFNERGLHPSVPLNVTNDLKLAAIGRCMESLLSLVEEPLKEYLRRITSCDGEYCPFVCEVKNKQLINSSRWNPNESLSPPTVFTFSLGDDIWKFIKAHYPEEAQIIKDFNSTANAIYYEKLVIILMVGIINKYMENGTTITPEMNLNKFRSEGEVMAEFINQDRRNIYIRGYNPVKLEVLKKQ